MKILLLCHVQSGEWLLDELHDESEDQSQSALLQGWYKAVAQDTLTQEEKPPSFCSMKLKFRVAGCSGLSTGKHFVAWLPWMGPEWRWNIALIKRQGSKKDTSWQANMHRRTMAYITDE